MAAVTICSDFGAPKFKLSHCFHCFPIYMPWSDGTGCHDLSASSWVKTMLVFQRELSPCLPGQLLAGQVFLKSHSRVGPQAERQGLGAPNMALGAWSLILIVNRYNPTLWTSGQLSKLCGCVTFVQAHCTMSQWIERWVVGGRNSGFIWKTSRPRRWWTSAPKNHLARVRIQASLYHSGMGCGWLLQTSWCQNPLFLQLST